MMDFGEVGGDRSASYLASAALGAPPRDLRGFRPLRASEGNVCGSTRWGCKGLREAAEDGVECGGLEISGRLSSSGGE